MRVSHLVVLTAAILLLAVGAKAQNRLPPNQAPFSPLYVPSGERIFTQFCSACHGMDGKGQGPAAASLKVPPPDLTTLAKRHMGKYPDEYVTSIILFGPGTSAHGASDMPTWGPVFLYLDKHDEAAARQRVKNLTDYLRSIQQN